jgi:hypothetical protein
MWHWGDGGVMVEMFSDPSIKTRACRETNSQQALERLDFTQPEPV